MKKVLLTLVLLGASFTPILAQDFKFGIRVDPQLAWLNENSEYLESGGSRLGFKFGLMADIGFSSNYSISTGIFLDQRGGKLTFRDDIPAGNLPPENVYFLKHRIQYLEIPISLRLRSNELSSGMSIYGQAGLNLGILTQYTIDGREISNNMVSEFTDRDFDNSRPINPTLLVGGGVEYPIDGQLSLLGGLAFQQGFISATSIDDYDYQTSRLSLQLGILF